MADTAVVPCIVLSEPEDELMALLEELQVWLFSYPVAARTLVSALITEGRRFADTAVGRRWQRRLTESELIRRARTVWDSSMLSSLDAPSDGPLPSAALDCVIATLMDSDLRVLLTQLSEWSLEDA